MNPERRRFLKVAGASTVGALLFGTYFWQQDEHDYIFFGEKHGITPKEIALDYVKRNGIRRVALEGLPQGNAWVKELQSIEQSEHDLEARTRELDKKLAVYIPKLEALPQLRREGKISSEEATAFVELFETAHDMLLKTYQLNGNTYGPGVRYARSLLEMSCEVLGLEEMGVFKQALLMKANNFSTLAQVCIGRIKKRAFENQEEQGTSAWNPILEAVSAYENIGVENSLIIPVVDLSASKLDALQSEADHVEKEGMVRSRDQRTQIWMDYLVLKTPIMAIYGIGHMDLAIEIAKRQGKDTHVAYREAA